MKTHRCIALALVTISLTSLVAKAQLNTQKPVVKAPANSDIKTTKMAEQIGDRYRLVMSFTPDRVEDSDYGNQETYGTLKINGVTWWQMLRESASAGGQTLSPYFIPNNLPDEWADDGVSLTKPSKFNQNRQFEFDALYNDKLGAVLNIELRLYDADGPTGQKTSPVDDLYGKYDEKLDLLKGAGNYWWFWDDGHSNKSRFFVRIEHVRKLYGSSGSSFPKVPEIKVIEKSKLPGKNPGPIIRKSSPIRR